MTPSSALVIVQAMTTAVEHAKTEHAAGLEATERAITHFAERDRVIREALTAAGARPSQREIARELGLSPARVAQIARGTR